VSSRLLLSSSPPLLFSSSPLLLLPLRAARLAAGRIHQGDLAADDVAADSGRTFGGKLSSILLWAMRWFSRVGQVVVVAGSLVVVGCGSSPAHPSSPTPSIPSAPTAPPAPPPAPVGPVPFVVHDTLVASDSAIINGSTAFRRQRDSYMPYDDFVPTQAGTIQSIRWQGYYCDRAFTGATIPSPNATGYRIGLAEDESGGEHPPFALAFEYVTTPTLQWVVIPAADVRQELEFTRLDGPCLGGVEGNPAAYYRYSADLPIRFEVKAGTRYWVGVFALIPDGFVQWFWRFGRQDNSYSRYFVNGVMTTFFGERAVAIHGLSIPQSTAGQTAPPAATR
jgi:hypothetical protein